jgi:hypothetical protein
MHASDVDASERPTDSAALDCARGSGRERQGHADKYFHTEDDKLAVSSVYAPALEKLTWRCLYIGGVAGLGFSALDAVNVDTCLFNDDLTRVTSLCFRYPSVFTRKYYKDLDFLNEIDKHMVTDMSVLKLYIGTRGHVFGPFVVHLLGMQLRGMHRICTPTRSLNIFLRASKVPKSFHCLHYIVPLLGLV